jgi:hypothetical protein
MIFIIKSTSKPYQIKKINQINYKIYFKKIKIKKKVDVFCFNKFSHNFSNLILIIFKRIEANYLYVYQKN